MENINISRKGIIIGSMICLLLGAVFYLIFFGEGGMDNDGGSGDRVINRSPVADAGRDIVVRPGELFYLNGSGSYDVDGDQLTYFWDMDIGKDANNDGINDNDRDREGVNISYSYPEPERTVEYIVTLNVSDGKLWDKSTVRVTVLVSDPNDGPPRITFSCRYQKPPLGLPGDPQFILTVSSVSRNESFTEFSYILKDTEGKTLESGMVVELINLSQTDEIRYIDTPPSLGGVDENDLFTLEENERIVEGCMFYLYYLSERVESGKVELKK